MSNLLQTPLLFEAFAAVQQAAMQQGGYVRRLSPTTFEIQGCDLQEHYLLTLNPTNPLDVDIVFLTGSTSHLR